MTEEVKDFLSAATFKRAFSRIYDLFVRKKEGYGLSKNDFTDEHKEKVEKLKNYTLPPATKKKLGGVIAGNGLSVDEDGKLAVLFPDLSSYATLKDIKNSNSASELRLVKIENAAKQNLANDEAFRNLALEKITLCDNKIDETSQITKENSKRFDDYVPYNEYETGMREVDDKLAKKADISTLNEALQKKITRSDLDGSLNNLLNTIQSEQRNAAEDRENLRSIKTDIASLNNLRQMVKANTNDLNYITQNMGSCLTSDALNDYMKKEPGKGLSECDFTDDYRKKLQILRNYTLPVATESSLGGIKAGKNVRIGDDGALNVEIPDVKNFITKKESLENMSELRGRISACEDKATKNMDDIGGLSSSIDFTKQKIEALKESINSQTLSMNKLASKEEVDQKIAKVNDEKVSVHDFNVHVNKKIGTDSFADEVKEKLNRIDPVVSDVNDLKKTLESKTKEINRYTGRINGLSDMIYSIRDDIPDGNTYVKVQAGKGLSTNDFTNKMKKRLMSAVVEDDIGSRVVPLDSEGKVSKDYLPDREDNVVYVDDITALTAGNVNTLYFNRVDKKLYYYDNVNFYKVHDDTWDEDGIDIRTAMADIYVKKSSLQEAVGGIESLEERYTHLQEQISQAEYDPKIYWQTEQPEIAPIKSLWLNPSNKKIMVQTDHGWKEFVVGEAISLDSIDEEKVYSVGDIAFSSEGSPGSCLVCVRGTN